MELDLQNKKTAEFALSQLFENWKSKDFKKLNKYVQKTWLLNGDKEEFKRMFGMFDLVDFYIYDKEVITDCRHEIDFRADVVFQNKKMSMYGKANTICEKALRTPSPDGKWGVNPISLLRWVKQK